MSATSRFRCPSSSLRLEDLLKRSRDALGIGLILSLGLHLLFTQLRGHREEQKVTKPLTTRFIKREPRLSKPLEIKKRPQPKRRTMQRKMVSVKANVERDRHEGRFQPMQVLTGLARPNVEIGRVAALEGVAAEPRTIAERVVGTKEVEQKVDMGLELLDIEALNTGRHHAMVVQDPEDKRNVRGFLHLAVVYSRSMYPPKYPRFENWIGPAMPRLADAMNRYTDVETDILGKFSLDSSEIFKAPWLYFMAFWPFELTDIELDNLGRYMLSGGFVFADSRHGWAAWRGGSLSVSSNILKALARQGFDLSYEKLPSSHPIYHCYFDFSAPPLAADHAMNERALFPYMEAVILEERVLVLFSKKGYYQPWAWWDEIGLDNTRPLQFAVNTIVFALTQEGSITHQLLRSVRY